MNSIEFLIKISFTIIAVGILAIVIAWWYYDNID